MKRSFLLIVEEAKKLGLKVEVMPGRRFATITGRGKSLTVLNIFFLCRKNYSESYMLADDKALTYYVWKKEKIPFPKTVVCEKKGDVEKIIKELKFPLVVKPSTSFNSQNIHPGIKDLKSLEKILTDNLKKTDKRLIVQEMVFGREYRILVYKDKVLACLENMPPNVLGDGKNTLKKLIEIKNRKKIKKIIINEKVKRTLRELSLGLNSVIEKNERVFLQRNCRLDEGGDIVDKTEEASEGLKSMTIKAARAVNLSFAGIDLICDDISKSPQEQEVHFLEINSRPSLCIHHFPHYGKSRNVTREILEDVFKINQKTGNK